MTDSSGRLLSKEERGLLHLANALVDDLMSLTDEELMAEEAEDAAARKPVKYWFDTEFIEAPGHLDLISIGIVCESGESLYMENAEVDWSRASQWVLDNVRPHLTGNAATRAQIAAAIVEFVADNGGPPEFWAYYADYDWVALCGLYGTMMDLPKGWPMYCRDLKQWADALGSPKLPDQWTNEHHALSDAHWNKQAWDFLRDLARYDGADPDAIVALKDARIAELEAMLAEAKLALEPWAKMYIAAIPEDVMTEKDHNLRRAARAYGKLTDGE